MGRTWRILSIDGGGTRGIIPATILASIEERTGQPISQLFDLIAGTSTGGILALGLTKPNSNGGPEVSAQELCRLYEQEIPNIFLNPHSWWGNLLRPKYRSFAFQEILKKTLGECRLKNALIDVLIPCYDIEHRSPYMFRSRFAKVDVQFDFPMRDVALAASASPTLFHPVRIPRTIGDRTICLVDGGVFANNPALTALAEIKSLSPSDDDKYFVVSLGTGQLNRPLTDEFVSLWGYVQWSRPMLELVMESISESVHQQIRYLLPSLSDDPHYYRLQVDLPQHTNPAIDNADPGNLQALSRAAQRFCTEEQSAAVLDKLCNRLLRLTEQVST